MHIYIYIYIVVVYNDVYIYIHIHIYILVGGIPTPLKNDGVKVSWDDDIPNYWGK